MSVELRKSPLVPMHTTFRRTGLLWYVNRVAFHPRGFALALDEQDDGRVLWELWGNGDEPYLYHADVSENAMFKEVEALFASVRGR